MLHSAKNLTIAWSFPPCGYRLFLLGVVVAAWIGTGVAYGQSTPAELTSPSEMQVPVQVLQSASTDQSMMMGFSGYYSDGTEVDPLSHYQRSRLGRWKVAKKVDRDDAVFGIQLETPVRTIRIRCETTINGKPFRAAREKTIDEFLEMADGAVAEAVEKSAEVPQETSYVGDPAPTEETEAKDAETKEEAGEETEERTEVKAVVGTVTPPPYVSSSNKTRLAAYARSRGDLLTRYELRRRVADISGGPALLRTNNDFGTERHETMTLFAFVDTDNDGVITQVESGAVASALGGCDLNSDNQVDLDELQRGLKLSSAKRKAGSTGVSWQSWDPMKSDDVEDISLQVAFSDNADKSSLKIGGAKLEESWELIKVDELKPNSNRSLSSSVLLSHPKVSVVLGAAQSAYNAKEEFNQVSIGVALEANALFRAIDQDGNWILSTIERRSCSDVIASLDTDSNGTLEASELPILLRVCVARGATAHKALAEGVSIVRQSDRADQAKQKELAPDWFASMDKDGDLTLTRDEFMGTRESFDKIDANENKRLSVEEVLATKLE